MHSRELGCPLRDWQGADPLELQRQFVFGLDDVVAARATCSLVALTRVFDAHEASSEYSTSGTRSA